MDDLLKEVIKYKYIEKHEDKPKGAVDWLVQEYFEKATRKRKLPAKK